jgi:lysophospholipase L1-like esterase
MLRCIKSFLLLFFKKDALLFLKKKKQKNFYVLVLAVACMGLAPLPPAARPYSRMDLPWWRARFEAKQAELQQMRGHVDLLWLGDSITQDFEQTGPQPWRDFKPVWDLFYGGRNAINLGFKGDATAHLLWRLENGETEGMRPKLAIVLIGANNFGHLHWPAEPTRAGIEAIVATLHRRLPETKILLLGVLPSIRSAWVDENTAALNRDLAARYGSGADRLVIYKDLSGLFLENGKVVPERFLDPRLAPPDPPLHPTAQTQARMAEAIEPVVSHILGDRNRSTP